MRTTILRSIVRAAATALIVIASAGAAAAVVSIDACGVLDAFGETYNVTADLHACGGDCLVVRNNRITIDVRGHTIVQNCPTPFGAGITDGGIARDIVVVKNAAIAGFVFGVELDTSTRTEVRNVAVGGNTLDGIVVGNRSLVKGCAAIDNGLDSPLGGDGIRGGDSVQVQDCEATGNGTSGIRLGNRCLVTFNTAEGNHEDGIATGGFCTVARNSANANDDDGIDVGHDGELDGGHSLVTLNRTDDNFDVGTRVACPSTITNNTSSDNGIDYVFDGNGCFASNNN